jgi:hypothetical protein
MSHDAEAESTAAQPKYTRYRSVRRAAADESAAKEQAAASVAAREQKGDGPVRSMSRYRRPRAVSKVEQDTNVTSVPAIPALPLGQLNQAVSRSATRRVAEPTLASQAQTTQFAPPRNVSEGEWTAGREIEDQRAFAKTVEEKLAEQKRKDLERLEATLDAAIQGPAVPRVASPAKEKFGFFSKKRAQTKSTPPAAPTSAPTSAHAPAAAPAAAPSSASIARSGGSNEMPRRSNEPPLPRPVGQGGAVIVPGTDAPISAVNAGERVSY